MEGHVFPLHARVIDLTHPLHPRMPVSVGFPRLMLTRYLDQRAGDVATVEIIQASTHTGTHVDAPFHFFADGLTVDHLDPLGLCGPAVVVDVPEDNSWRAIGADDLRAWETLAGETIVAGDVVLLRTGHAHAWKDLPRGVAYMTDPWPYLSASAADLLTDRQIRALGVECPDPDRVDQRDLDSATFETHRRLLGAGIPIIENLANLDLIPAIRCMFVALALPIASASGAPIRALAVLPE
jgi:arylformamidase